jgi:hypothetical protein
MRVGLDLVGSIPFNVDWNGCTSLLDNADLVVVNGEGSIHHGKRQDLLDLSACYPTALVNCVYQDNPPNPNLRHFRYVAARESLSAKELARNGVEAEVVPDVSLTASTLRLFKKTTATDDLGCTDNVTDPASGFPIKYDGVTASDYLHRLCSYRRLCIGRFHAAIMAASLEIPFSAWASNTHKTKGLLLDMGIPEYFSDKFEDALSLVPATFPDKVRQYVAIGRTKINEMFATLRRLAGGSGAY